MSDSLSKIFPRLPFTFVNSQIDFQKSFGFLTDHSQSLLKSLFELAASKKVIDETFRGGANIDVVRIEARKFNYLFSDGTDYTFMDNETFDQIALNKDHISEVKDFLIENLETTIAFNGDDPVEIRIPPHVNMEVMETDPGERGNTAQGGTKPAILETGVSVQVPLFIQIQLEPHY